MRKVFRSVPLVLLALAILALGGVLAACGGGTATAPTGQSSGAAAATAQTVVVTADTSALKWDKPEYTASAGDVTFAVSNPSPMVHQFSVEGNGVDFKSPDLNAGAKQNFTVKGLKPGTYQLVCNVPGHKEAGMVSKLIVK